MANKTVALEYHFSVDRPFYCTDSETIHVQITEEEAKFIDEDRKNGVLLGKDKRLRAIIDRSIPRIRSSSEFDEDEQPNVNLNVSFVE